MIDKYLKGYTKYRVILTCYTEFSICDIRDRIRNRASIIPLFPLFHHQGVSVKGCVFFGYYTLSSFSDSDGVSGPSDSGSRSSSGDTGEGELVSRE